MSNIKTFLLLMCLVNQYCIYAYFSDKESTVVESMSSGCRDNSSFVYSSMYSYFEIGNRKKENPRTQKTPYVS